MASLVVVQTPAPTQDLVVLARLKAELGLTGSQDDTELQDIITEVSQTVVDRCGRVFAQETVTETLQGTNDLRLVLARTPVMAIASVAISGQVLLSTDYFLENADAGILYRTIGWMAFRSSVAPISLDVLAGTGEPNIVVTYTGGFILPTFDAIDTATPLIGPRLPGSVSRAALELAKVQWQTRARDRGLASERIGDYSYTRRTAADVLADLDAVLAPWMRVRA